MKSRMEKYFNEEEVTSSRTSKNQELYKKISNYEFDKYNPNNNVKVIGDNENSIDVDKIRKLLETNYKETPKRKTIKIDDIKDEEIDLEPTKEYDINSILKKAHAEKEVDYEKERLKKIHDTQYDILNNLYKEEKKEEDLEKTQKENELMDLINTITSKELKEKEMDPLELFSDLKGHDETTVMHGLKEKVEEKQKEELDKTKENEKIEDKNKKLVNSFYTTTNAFSKSDFDDFNDLKDDMTKTKIIIKILIVFVVIAFVVGILFLMNNYFNLF